jgi:anti-anti-sigma factor
MISRSAGATLCLSDIAEITAVSSQAFVHDVKAALDDSTTVVEFDLAETRFMDSAGLGALFTIYRAAGERGEVTLRLVNTRPHIRQLLELTQMEKFYEIA